MSVVSVYGISENATNELRVALTLLIMTSFHAGIYILESISWETVYINNIMHFLDDTTKTILEDLGEFADQLASFTRAWSFIVYFSGLKSFVTSVSSCFLYLGHFSSE